MNIYDTKTLLAVTGELKPVSSYWIDRLFPKIKMFETESVVLDDISDDFDLAPYVAPSANGVVMKDQGFSTKEFKPAYLQPAHAVRPVSTLTRMAGESINGSLSPQQRYDAAVANNLLLEKNAINRRIEKMASECIINGNIVVSGEHYPERTIDFGRDANNTVTLSGASLWNTNAQVDIIGDLERWRNEVFEISGRSPDLLTMSPDVWEVFRKNEGVKESLDRNYSGQVGVLNLGLSDSGDFSRKGVLGSDLVVEVYRGRYKNDSGQVVNSMPDKTIILSSTSDSSGVICYGAIMDFKAGLVPAEIFPSMYKEGKNIMTLSQSAPLPVYGNINSTFKAIVL